MPQFFDLPRELRDMIYFAIITWSSPRPTATETALNRDWVWDRENTTYTDTGCIFSTKKLPSTCANFLATSRQINEEMLQSITRARRKGLLCARLDCLSSDGWTHHFKWLSVPIVQTTTKQPHPPSKHVAGWAPNMPVVRRLLAVPQRTLSACTCTSTTIEKVQIDVRLRYKHPHISQDCTSWAVCAALKWVFESGSVKGKKGACVNEITIDTLVLNVIPASLSAEEMASTSSKSDPHAVARGLVDVWNKLWAGDGFRSRSFGGLLERIQRVRVCVDGVLIRERELGLELERGQAERRRIARRVGW
jgi:hypothetical protein